MTVSAFGSRYSNLYCMCRCGKTQATYTLLSDSTQFEKKILAS